MRRINEEFHEGFREYLFKLGKNPDTMTEKQAETILAKLTQ